MTLSQVENQANRGRLATGDFNVSQVLRWEILPEFYREVCAMSDPTWTHKHATLPLTAAREYDLPEDFQKMLQVGLLKADGSRNHDLKYIGEDTDLVIRSEAATPDVPEHPMGYYIGPGVPKKLKFNAYPLPGSTVPYVYRSRLVVYNDTDDYDLDEFIPEDYQSALIIGTRREILLDRFGQGDPRYAEAKEQFLYICDQAREQAHDPARRDYAVYSR